MSVDQDSTNGFNILVLQGPDSDYDSDIQIREVIQNIVIAFLGYGYRKVIIE